jgi:hypothetical protein
MFSLFFELLSKVVEMIKNNNEIERAKKLDISGVLSNISSILLDTSVKLSEDKYPYNNCQMMENLSDTLHKSLNGYVDDDTRNKIHELLKEASQLEKLYQLRENKEIIRELMRISGEFNAMSILIKL